MPVSVPAADASFASYQELADACRQADTIAITAHREPDGDALGSVLALAMVCNSSAKLCIAGYQLRSVPAIASWPASIS